MEEQLLFLAQKKACNFYPQQQHPKSKCTGWLKPGGGFEFAFGTRGKKVTVSNSSSPLSTRGINP